MKDRREEAQKDGYEQVTPQGMETLIADRVEKERCIRLAVARVRSSTLRSSRERQDQSRDLVQSLDETRHEIETLESFDSRATLYDVDPETLDRLKNDLPDFVREMRADLERSWESALQQREDRSRSIVDEYGDPETSGRDVPGRAIEPGD